MKKKVLFLGIFLAMALALCVTAAGATDAPAASQPTVKLWAFYDKDVNAYPTGWWYLDPVITDPMGWQQDSPWLAFPSPHYALYGGTWGSETMGALVQEGDFGPGVAEIPLADGLYWVVLSAPPGNWSLTTDSVQKVYVWNGNVYVQWANEGLWYGDKVLVGIVDGYQCWFQGQLTYQVYNEGSYAHFCEIWLNGGPAYREFYIWGPGFSGYATTDSSGYFNYDPEENYYSNGTYTFYVQDTQTNCIWSFSFVVDWIKN